MPGLDVVLLGGSRRSISHMSCILVNSLGSTFLDLVVRVLFVHGSRTLRLCRRSRGLIGIGSGVGLISDMAGGRRDDRNQIRTVLHSRVPQAQRRRVPPIPCVHNAALFPQSFFQNRLCLRGFPLRLIMSEGLASLLFFRFPLKDVPEAHSIFSRPVYTLCSALRNCRAT